MYTPAGRAETSIVCRPLGRERVFGFLPERSKMVKGLGVGAPY